MHSAKIMIFVMALIVILLKIIMLTWLAPQIYRVVLPACENNIIILPDRIVPSYYLQEQKI